MYKGGVELKVGPKGLTLPLRWDPYLINKIISTPSARTFSENLRHRRLGLVVDVLSVTCLFLEIGSQAYRRVLTFLTLGPSYDLLLLRMRLPLRA